jgi:hypothetical protein
VLAVTVATEKPDRESQIDHAAGYRAGGERLHRDMEAKINLKVADDAALGDFTVKVTGHPTSGADATNEFKMTGHEKVAATADGVNREACFTNNTVSRRSLLIPNNQNTGRGSRNP